MAEMKIKVKLVENPEWTAQVKVVKNEIKKLSKIPAIFVEDEDCSTCGKRPKTNRKK